MKETMIQRRGEEGRMTKKEGQGRDCREKQQMEGVGGGGEKRRSVREGKIGERQVVEHE